VTQTHLLRRILLWLLLALAAPCAAAQDFDFRAPASATDPALPAAMRDLARRIIPVYQQNDPERYLSNLSALQMVAGDYASAWASRQSLRDRRRSANVGPVGRAAVYDIYANARAIEAGVRIPFAQAYAQAFRNNVNRLDDLDAYILGGWLGESPATVQEGLQRALDQRRGKTSVTLQEAIDLIWAFFAFEAYRSFSSLAGPLKAEEDRRRYIRDDEMIRTPEGQRLAAVVVRPRIASGKLPALLEFTILDSQERALEAAAHGYAGIVAHSRGVGGSSGTVVPFVHDGGDAHAVIEWIARQPWSDGRVGMFGSQYSGFTAWAAAKHAPAALKAIATVDAMAPGIDFPMTGHIFHNAAYRWAFDVTSAPEDRRPDEDARWRAFDEDWYRSGRRYREFAGVSGLPGTLFRQWLNHPSYDRYWQKMVPYRNEFAQVRIPVLTIAGYFSGASTGALYYFTQHHRYNEHANDTLLAGPYDGNVMRDGPAPVIEGYHVDPVALIDLRALRYEWFDSVFKKGNRPALLKERVNYQVMGANLWQHAPSIPAMANDSLKLYLRAAPAEGPNQLLPAEGAPSGFLPQTFDLADRSDASVASAASLVSRVLKPRNGELYVSEPLQQSLEINGLLSGRLDFTVNKMDMDITLGLYELMPSGEYLKLFDPAYEVRASYAKDRSRRQLLKAGVRQQLPFTSDRLTSRKLQAGSRIVILLGIVKRPDRQINYGTGDDVSEESIEDAGVPLRIRWYDSSFLDIPVRR